jgi:hypothetical protein
MPAGMPLMIVAFFPLEFVVTPHTTYVLIGEQNHYRRIFTDGRDWPKEIEPTYQGYSIGKWSDEDGDGTFDVLEVERAALSRAPALTMQPACRFNSITSRSSGNESTATRPTRTFFTTKSP